MPEQSPNELEALKLGIEQDKLALEREKLELERKKSVWTAVLVVIPVIAVAATIIWGIVSSREQAALTFRLEAAKTVMATKTYGESVSQATFLRENFPDQLGQGFFPKLNMRDFRDAGNVAAKWNFMQYIASRGLTPAQAQVLYHLLYPDDDGWAYRDDVRQLLNQASNKSGLEKVTHSSASHHVAGHDRSSRLGRAGGRRRQAEKSGKLHSAEPDLLGGGVT